MEERVFPRELCVARACALPSVERFVVGVGAGRFLVVSSVCALGWDQRSLLVGAVQWVGWLR